MNKSKTHIQVKNNTGYAVNANILVGDSGSFSSGDILDANAVEELINSKISNIIGGASAASDTLGEIEQQTSGLDSRLSSIEAKEILKTLIWRWWYSTSDHPIFLLCDSEGKLLKTSAGRTESCELSGSVMGQPTSITDAKAAQMANSWGTSSRTFNIVAEGVEIDGTMIETSALVNLPRKVSEFEVLPGDASPRPAARYAVEFRVANFVDIGYGMSGSYGPAQGEADVLQVWTPDDSDPGAYYGYTLWDTWYSPDTPQPIAAGTITNCDNESASTDPLPASAVWSFGNLVDY